MNLLINTLLHLINYRKFAQIIKMELTPFLVALFIVCGGGSVALFMLSENFRILILVFLVYFLECVLFPIARCYYSCKKFIIQHIDDRKKYE